MRLGRTALADWLSRFVVSITGFVATFAIAVLLGTEALGTYSVIVAFGFWFLLLPMNATSTAMTKRISEGLDQGRFLGAGTILNVVAAILVAALVVVVGTALDPAGYGSEFVSVFVDHGAELVLLILGSTLFLTVTGGLKGHKRVGTVGGLNAVERLFRTGGQVIVAVVGLGAAALAVAHVVSLVTVAAAGGLLLVTIHRPALPERRHFLSILEYVRYGWLSTLQSRIFGWLDTIVLSLFVGAGLIGIYEAAWGIGSLLATASTSVRRTLFPEVSDLSTVEEFDQIRHVLDEGLVFSGIFVIPGLVGAAVIGERVLRFYRPEFARGHLVLVLLVVAYAGDAYGSQFLNVLNGIDRPDASYQINLLFIGSNVVLNVLLIASIGWVGAAIATAASSLLRMTFGYRKLGTILGDLTFPAREVGVEVVSAVMMGVCVLAVRDLVPDGRVGTLLLVGFGSVVYSVLLLTLAARIRRKVRALCLSLLSGDTGT
ncbi:MAG: polysaccharide biosynthesis C-terminal domain-containing protein [Salinirussus sp.]